MNYQVMPEMSDYDFSLLKSDIAKRGVLVPVEYDEDGNILDGHHRVRACEELGVTDWPKFIRKGLDESGKNEHALQLNVARRHLSRDQKRGLVKDTLIDSPETSNRAIAAQVGVDHKTVGTIRKEIEEGGEIPHLSERVSKDGQIQPAKKLRTSFVDDSDTGKVEAIARSKEIRADKAVEKRAERVEKINEISAGNEELDLAITYPVIYADPPWRYDHIESESRAIENQYPTMNLQQICDMPVEKIASKDCILFMWTTSPKLEESFSVLNSWGFTYKTCGIWDKQKKGLGYYFRQQHEILLIGTRGNIPTPLPANRPDSIFKYPRSEHSAKPHEVAEMIEEMYPDFKRIELFCRSPRDGWNVWGNQSAA